MKTVTKLSLSCDASHAVFQVTRRHDTRSSNSENLNIKASRLEIQKNAFSRMGAKLWNEIPSSLRELPKNSFKLRIKDKLLSVLEDEDSFIDICKIISKLKCH